MVGGDDDDGGGGAVLSSNRSGNWPGAQQLPQNSARSLASLPSRQPEPLHVGGIFTTCRATPASWQRRHLAPPRGSHPGSGRGAWRAAHSRGFAPRSAPCAGAPRPRQPSPARARLLETFSSRWRVSKHDESLQKSPMPLKKVSKPAAR
jgi:hypothetical protein